MIFAKQIAIKVAQPTAAANIRYDIRPASTQGYLYVVKGVHQQVAQALVEIVELYDFRKGDTAAESGGLVIKRFPVATQTVEADMAEDAFHFRTRANQNPPGCAVLMRGVGGLDTRNIAQFRTRCQAFLAQPTAFCL